MTAKVMSTHGEFFGLASSRKETQKLITEIRKASRAPKIVGSREELQAIGAREFGGTIGFVFEGTGRGVPCEIRPGAAS